MSSPLPSRQPPPPPFLPPDELKREEHDSQQVKIQIALFGTFVFFVVILALGRLRSHGGTTMKLWSTNLFIITGYLITYIPGLMSSAGESNDLYIFWAAFMGYLAAVANEMSCYTRAENEDRKKRLLIDYTVVWPLILTSLYNSLASPEIIVPIVIVFWVVVLKLRERSRALLYATDSADGLSRATNIVSEFADYQKTMLDQINESSHIDLLVGIKEAQQMVKKSKHKPNDFDLSNRKVITLYKIYDPSNDVGKELQNTCFSFGMFWVLLAKMAGYKNVDGKIFKDGYKLPENTFDLIDEELEYLYEYLFTNSYAIYDRGIWKKILDICVITLFFWLTLPLMVEYRSENHNMLYVILWKHVLDNGFTRFVILAIIIIEFAQITIYLTSKWAKVMYTCSYLENKSPWGSKPKTSKLLLTIIRFTCLLPRPTLAFLPYNKFTKGNIGQYSILKDHSAIPSTMWFKCWIGSYINVPKKGHAGDKDKPLPKDVRQLFVNAIDDTRLGERKGKFSNGSYSLTRNSVEEDVINTYMGKEMSQARIILIWHIATTMFENERTQPKLDDDIEVKAATIISNYCAYLVALFPHMLPDHVYKTRCEFDQTVKELEKEVYEDTYVDHEVPSELNDKDSILHQGRKLKEILGKQPNLWKTLAEFWTERLLFLALSDHGEAIEAHADSLCVGGEFITHLWALLTHAGCSRTANNY